MLKIKVYDDYNLYKKHTFEFNEGITCLIGKNGAGKSTLLKVINDLIDNCYFYNNEDSEKNAMSKFGYLGNIEKLCRNFTSSEGQNIRNNFEDIIPNIGQYVRNCIKNKQNKIIILLDGLDSGISLDYIITLKKELFSLIIEDSKNNNLEPYIILSANNYELCNGEDCIRVSDAKHFKFKDYNEFRKIYTRSK